MVRGHFKTYTAEAKHVGTYWWQPAIRGDREHGVVQSSYKSDPDTRLSSRSCVEAAPRGPEAWSLFRATDQRKKVHHDYRAAPERPGTGQDDRSSDSRVVFGR
jgi:hypothetical protein